DHVERARALVEDDDTLFTLREKLDREKIPYRLARARTVTDDGMTLVTEVAIPLGKKGEESIASFTTGM
ncbi:MAG: hypothetical protein AAGK21_17850, partial [Bacteroidota bacterium]